MKKKKNNPCLDLPATRAKTLPLAPLQGGDSAESSPVCRPLAQVVKHLPATQETWVQPLGQQDPLEEETATHTSILARDIPRTEEPDGLQSKGSQRVRRD